MLALSFLVFLLYRNSKSGFGHRLRRITGYTFISSQPGRMLNDFRNLGFNEDEFGHRVFDGMMQWISAGDGINMNLREQTDE
jgi:hypothetical protein